MSPRTHRVSRSRRWQPRAAALWPTALALSALACASSPPATGAVATGYTAEGVDDEPASAPEAPRDLTPVGPTRELDWLSDEPSARAQAARDGRALIIDFRADWCGPCIDLETRVFAAAAVAEVLEGFVRLRVDLTVETESSQAVAAKYAVEGLPTVLMLDAQGHELDRVRTFIAADEMLARLRAASAGPR